MSRCYEALCFSKKKNAFLVLWTAKKSHSPGQKFVLWLLLPSHPVYIPENHGGLRDQYLIGNYMLWHLRWPLTIFGAEFARFFNKYKWLLCFNTVLWNVRMTSSAVSLILLFGSRWGHVVSSILRQFLARCPLVAAGWVSELNLDSVKKMKYPIVLMLNKWDMSYEMCHELTKRKLWNWLLMSSYLWPQQSHISCCGNLWIGNLRSGIRSEHWKLILTFRSIRWNVNFTFPCLQLSNHHNNTVHGI
jgi:hypothetical protein